MLISEIKVPKKWRLISEGKVKAIATSFQIIGQLQDIIVSESGTLLAGRHRLDAAKSLGWEEIAAKTVKHTGDSASLITLDENICRGELGVVEKVVAIREQQALYKALYPDAGKHGGDRTQPQDAPPAFANVAAVSLQVSPRTVRRYLQIGNGLKVEVPESLDLNAKQLQLLSDMDEEGQERLISYLTTGFHPDFGTAYRCMTEPKEQVVSATTCSELPEGNPTDLPGCCGPAPVFDKKEINKKLTAALRLLREAVACMSLTKEHQQTFLEIEAFITEVVNINKGER